jgi:hypothetical protein
MKRSKKLRKIWFYLVKAKGFNFIEAKHHTSLMSEGEFNHTLEIAKSWIKK